MFIWIAIIIVIIGILAPYLVSQYADIILMKLKLDNLGAVGDFLAGTTTPFFTISAFVMLLYGSFLQRTEMKATIKGLEKQLSLMKEEKNLTEEKQKLDIFIVLFDNWQKVRSSLKLKTIMKLDKDGTYIRGNESIYINIHEYSIVLQNIFVAHDPNTKLNFQKIFNIIGDQRSYGTEQKNIIENYTTILLPYFRNLAFLLEYAQKSNSKIILNFLNDNIDNNDLFIVSNYISIAELNDFNLNLTNKLKQYLVISKDKDNTIKKIKLPYSLSDFTSIR